MVGNAVDIIVASVEERTHVTHSATMSIQNLRLRRGQYIFDPKEKFHFYIGVVGRVFGTETI